MKKLLDKYRGMLARGYLPFQEKPKLTYQEEGLELQKFCFRSDDADWYELGILAYGCGVSRCWLFSCPRFIVDRGVCRLRKGDFWSYFRGYLKT